MDLERVRNSELMAALERESDEAKSLTLTLDKERQQTREEIAKQVRLCWGCDLDRSISLVFSAKTITLPLFPA